MRQLSKKLYIISCVSLTLLFIAVMCLHFFLPIAVEGVYISAKPVSQQRLLKGNNKLSDGEISLVSGERININTATEKDLTALPGIGPSLAAAIVSYREENGPFLSTDALLNVPGIGDGRFAAVSDYITVDG